MFIINVCDIMHSMKKIVTKILSFVLVLTLALSFVGCAENADVFETEEVLPDYEEVCQSFEDYRLAYSTYREENDNDIYKVTDGYTTKEISCSVRYIEADNGVYRMAELEASRNIDNYEVPVRDTYYSLSDSDMYITRWYVDNAGNYILTEFLVRDGILYSVNHDLYEIDREDRADFYDFYLDFNQIKSLYGAS